MQCEGILFQDPWDSPKARWAFRESLADAAEVDHAEDLHIGADLGVENRLFV
jgi:hypothetical protein